MAPHDDTPLLELEDISVHFGFLQALKGINLAIARREVVSIVGDNGAGKSTLIKIIAGFIQPDSGIIRFDGKRVTPTSIREADALGIASVFQGQEFCDNLNVAANLFLGKEARRPLGLRNDEAMNGRAREVLKTLASSIRVGQSIASLSTGQRQTVAIARTLLNDPQLILLDEPTASLSVMQTAEVLSYIKRLRSEGRSVLMVCHDLPDVFAVSDRIIVLRQGRINGIHATEHTSYEQIIAEISGVADDSEGYSSISSSQQYGGMIEQCKLIDRSRSESASMLHEPTVDSVEE